MNIQELPTEFIGQGEVRGFNFKQCGKTDTHYIYKVDDTHFEVFQRKSVPVCIDFENRIYSETEFKEVYPKSADFGVTAWTAMTYTKAIEKLTVEF